MATKYINGNIYTVDEANPRATTMVVDDAGKLLYVGTKEGAAIFDATQTVNLAGQTVTPGFIDAHSHIGALLANMAAEIKEVDQYKTTLQDLRNFLQELTSADPKPEYVTLKGYFLTTIFGEFRHGTAEDIDDVCNDVPVIMYAADGHSVWMNTAMKEYLGYGPGNIPESVRGSKEFFYKYDEEGNRVDITGYVNEGVLEVFFNTAMPYIQPDKLAPHAQAVLDMYRGNGFTGVFDPGSPSSVKQVLRDLDDAGQLDMYIEACWIAGREDGTLEEFLHRGDNYNMRTCKAFEDGTLEQKNIALIEPYADDGSNCDLFMDMETMYGYMKHGLDCDCNLHIHAIGDRSQLEALQAYKRLEGIKPHLTRTIAHNQVNSPHAMDLWESMKENAFYNTTPCWASEDETTRLFLGDFRTDNQQFLAKQAIDRGVRVTFGEDFPANPIELMNPMLEIRDAVCRAPGRTYVSDGEEHAYIGPDNSAVTREEALKAYTIWCAQQMTIDDKTGSLEVGKNADFTIWSADFMDEAAIPDYAIGAVTVKETFFRGKKVYEA